MPNHTPNSDPNADETLPGDEDASTTDRTDEVYTPSRLLKVEIELNPNDWDALRSQERTGEDLNIGADCLPPSEPFESPFSWFTGIVTVDGERLTNVGIRKKGFIGSMNENKPSLKIRFDKFEEDQTYLDAKRLTLNNDVQDPSYVRQCLAYDLFRAVEPLPPAATMPMSSSTGSIWGCIRMWRVSKSHSSVVTSAIERAIYTRNAQRFPRRLDGNLQPKDQR